MLTPQRVIRPTILIPNSIPWQCMWSPTTSRWTEEMSSRFLSNPLSKCPGFPSYWLFHQSGLPGTDKVNVFHFHGLLLAHKTTEEPRINHLCMRDLVSLLPNSEEPIDPDSEAESENMSLPSPDDSQWSFGSVSSWGLEVVFWAANWYGQILGAWILCPQSLSPSTFWRSFMLQIQVSSLYLCYRVFVKLPWIFGPNLHLLQFLLGSWKFHIRSGKMEPVICFNILRLITWSPKYFPPRVELEHILAPLDKEGHGLDSLGWKIYSSSSMGLCFSSFTAVTGHYQMLLWDHMGQFVDSLPDDKKAFTRIMLLECQKLGKQQLHAATHAADCHSRAMASDSSYTGTINWDPLQSCRILRPKLKGFHLFNVQMNGVLDHIHTQKKAHC